VTQKAASYLSEQINSKVEIKGVDIDLFKKIVLESVYIEDMHKDTLLYAEKLKLDIGHFSTSEKTFDLDDIILLNTKAKLIKYKNEKDFNFQFIVDKFSSKDSTKKDSGNSWKVNFSGLTIINSDFVYKDENDSAKTKGINYYDLDVKKINGKITAIAFNADTIKANVNYLTLQEKSRFILKDLSCNATINPVELQFDDLTIATPNSKVVTDNLYFKYNGYKQLTDFINKVQFKSRFEKTKIDMNDIAFFAPQVTGINKILDFEGDVSGKINDLRGNDLKILFGKYSKFEGKVCMTGLPDIDETFIHLNIKDLETGKSDLEQLPLYPFNKGEHIQLPNNIGMLGMIKFKGDFTGFYNDFVTYGNFSTALGIISSDIAMQQDSSSHVIKYKGKIKSPEFNLGKFTFTDKYIGEITVDADIDGQGLDENTSGNLKGIVKSIEINQYNYQNINVEGNLAKKIFNGKLSINDYNIDLKFDGDIDFTRKIPVLDFSSSINHANLIALNIVKNRKSSVLSTNLDVKISGNTLDNLLGEIKITNTFYNENNESYTLKNLNILAENNNQIKTLQLQSDIADGELTGDYNLNDLSESFTNFLHNYIPSYIKKDNRATSSTENLEFNFKVENYDGVTKLFFPQLKIAANTSVSGKYNSKNNSINLDVTSDQVSLYGNQLKKFKIHLANENQSLNLTTNCERLAYGDSSGLDQFSINAHTENDSCTFKLQWENKTKNKYKADVNGQFTFMNNNTMKFQIKPSEIYVADSLWKIPSDNEIVIDSGKTVIKNLSFRNNNQSIKLEGAVSNDKNDQLVLSLDSFNLSSVNFLTKNISSAFKGSVSGNASVSSLYNKPIFSSSLNFNNLSLNNEYIGKGSVNSSYNKEKDLVSFNGSFTKGIVPNVQFTGTYHPSQKEDNIDIELAMEAFKMELFEKYVKDYCSDFKGQVSGKLDIKGTFANPVMKGKLNMQAKKITVNYLNTGYSFASDITVEPNSFGVENLQLSDLNGNSAIVNGKIYHTNYKNFQLDFDINANKFMCLNTTESNNTTYYGKAFATGIMNIFGFLDNLTFDANIKTTKGTHIVIPLSNPSELGENDFISFVKKDTVSKKADDTYKVKLKGMQLNFNLDVTPDAEVQIILDAKAGDVIKGKGNGNIKMTINTLGNFNMYGDYVIESGDYLFTLKNVISKKFDIEKGGTIKWTGDPYNATINLSAVYKLRTPLSPLFPYDITGAYKKRFPVNCKLILSNDLMKPDISFDIELPTVDESTRQVVKDQIKTDQDMNKQVFSLLVLNSFLTETDLGSASAATSSELLSSQLSNVLSKASKNVDVGVNYRPADQIASKQVEVALSTQLFNDKLSIDGNVGVAGTNGATGTASETTVPGTNTSNIVGDVNVEYKLSDDGKLRLKAFNKTNDNTMVISNGPYTQGAGVAYREEFNTVGELYKKFLKKLKKKK